MPRAAEPTCRMAEYLVAIRDLIGEKRYPPTYREIGRKVGVSSSATVHRQMKNLKKRGFIQSKGYRTMTITEPGHRFLERLGAASATS